MNYKNCCKPKKEKTKRKPKVKPPSSSEGESSSSEEEYIIRRRKRKARKSKAPAGDNGAGVIPHDDREAEEREYQQLNYMENIIFV